MIRSLVFTAMLEEPEFRALDSRDGERIVTDAVLRVELDQSKDPSLTLAEIMRNYVSDVTGGGACEPGVWSRYLAALRAGDEVRP